MFLKGSLGARWDCPGCGAHLEFDPMRRLNVAGFSALLGGGPAVIGATTRVWWLVGLGAIVYAFILSFDAVRLKDGTGRAPARRG